MFKKLLGAAAVLALSTGVASAAITYSLNLNNAGLGDADFAFVTLDTVGDDISMKVSVNTSAFSVSGNNFRMDQFFFNADESLGLTASNINMLTPTDWVINENRNAGGGFGKFDFQLKGDGNSGVLEIDLLIQNVIGDTLESYTVLNNEGYMFAAHIAGFDLTNGVTSAKFASDGSTPVPLPLPLVLFGSGLVGLMGFTRKTRKSA